MEKELEPEFADALMQVFRELCHGGEFNASRDEVISFLRGEGYNPFVINYVVEVINDMMDKPVPTPDRDRGRTYLRIISYLDRLYLDRATYATIYKLVSSGLLVGAKLEEVLKTIMMESVPSGPSRSGSGNAGDRWVWEIVRRCIGDEECDLYRDYITNREKGMIH